MAFSLDGGGDANVTPPSAVNGADTVMTGLKKRPTPTMRTRLYTPRSENSNHILLINLNFRGVVTIKKSRQNALCGISQRAFDLLEYPAIIAGFSDDKKSPLQQKSGDYF